MLDQFFLGCLCSAYLKLYVRYMIVNNRFHYLCIFMPCRSSRTSCSAKSIQHFEPPVLFLCHAGRRVRRALQNPFSILSLRCYFYVYLSERHFASGKLICCSERQHGSHNILGFKAYFSSHSNLVHSNNRVQTCKMY